MSIEADLDSSLKQAMRDRDQSLLGCIRQVRAKIQEEVNAKGFSGRVDDALYQRVIGAYVKGTEAADFSFTSALATQVFKILAPALSPILDEPALTAPRDETLVG